MSLDSLVWGKQDCPTVGRLRRRWRYNRIMGAVECHCPKINLEEWRDREVTLAGHSFLSSPTPLFFHVPRRFYQDLARLESRVKLTGAPLVLHRDGWFSGEILISIDPQPEASPGVVSFRNVFYSRVVE